MKPDKELDHSAPVFRSSGGRSGEARRTEPLATVASGVAARAYGTVSKALAGCLIRLAIAAGDARAGNSEQGNYRRNSRSGER